MFLDFIGKVFIFITIYLMTIFIYNIAFLVAEYFMFLAYSKYILN